MIFMIMLISCLLSSASLQFAGDDSVSETTTASDCSSDANGVVSTFELMELYLPMQQHHNNDTVSYWVDDVLDHRLGTVFCYVMNGRGIIVKRYIKKADQSDLSAPNGISWHKIEGIQD